MDPLLDRLYAHLAWADQRVLESLEALPEPPAEALKLFAHILGAERVWAARLRQEPVPHPVWPELGLAECRTLTVENAGAYRALLADPGLPARIIEYRNSKGEPFRSAASDILLHVALHGAHHRGQVASRLRQAGATPAVTDLILYARTASPGA